MALKKIVFFVFIILSLFVINSLLHSIYSLWQKHSLLDRAEHTLRMEKQKNSELKKQLTLVSQPQFIEEEARNKLFLVKPGEGVVVIAPTEYLQASSSANGKPIDARPNWKQWWSLFF